MTSKLVEKECSACSNITPALSEKRIKALMHELNPGWQLNNDQTTITRVFEFKGYYKTMALVNAIAWVAHREGHHPDMQISYNRCIVNYTTHAMNGLSENDFICAAKVDAL